MDKSNEKKRKQSGMPIGTASGILKKNILFDLLKRYKENICFQCNEEIESVDNLSIEHKTAWLDSENPVELFFDLDNIAFSHLSCNVAAARKCNKGNMSNHGTYTRYTAHRCRCALCKEANRVYVRDYRTRTRSK